MSIDGMQIVVRPSYRDSQRRLDMLRYLQSCNLNEYCRGYVTREVERLAALLGPEDR